MTKTNKSAFFTMDMVREVVKMKDLEKARELAVDAINAKPDASPENIRKANSMVYNAKTIEKLAIAMSNFLLSHDGNKVLK